MRSKTGELKRREWISVGAKIADQIPKQMGLGEVALKLGISETSVRNIECLAFYKIQIRLKELLDSSKV